MPCAIGVDGAGGPIGMGTISEIASVAHAATNAPPRWAVDVAREGGFTHTITTAAGHVLTADEPLRMGGANLGTSPVELLMGATGSCAAMTVEKAAAKLGWPLGSVDVTVAADNLKAFTVDAQLGGDLTAAQQSHLREVAQQCAIADAISGSASVHESMVQVSGGTKLMAAPDADVMRTAAAAEPARVPGTPMATVTVHRKGADLAHSLSDGRGHEIAVDAPVGYAGVGTGASPIELLLASLGSCAAMTAEMSANKRGLSIGAIDAHVSASSLSDIRIAITVHGDLTPDEVAKIAGAAERCPVVQAVRGGVTVTVDGAGAA